MADLELKVRDCYGKAMPPNVNDMLPAHIRYDGQNYIINDASMLQTWKSNTQPIPKGNYWRTHNLLEPAVSPAKDDARGGHAVLCDSNLGYDGHRGIIGSSLISTSSEVHHEDGPVT
ncbi:hypothetical protein GB937_008117 [Aspergillus fischeri]|nr:hypothetical protein GB937_008117 [Aspergillus fischeri]